MLGQGNQHGAGLRVYLYIFGAVLGRGADQLRRLAGTHK